MKIKETLTSEEIQSLYLGNNPVGVFSSLFEESDLLYSYAYALSFGYYTVRSANKTVSPIYDTIFEYLKALAEDDLDDFEPNADFISAINQFIGVNILRPKFIDKWNRVFSLLNNDYDALNDFDYTDQKTGNNTDKTDYNTDVAKTGNNEDKVTYNTSTVNDGTVGTKETTTSNRENASDVYGFNSPSPVGDSVDNENVTETVEGKAEDNTTHNTQNKTGTDTKNIGINENEKKTGTDTKSFTINETLKKSGRNTSGAELIETELTMRDKEIFFDIIYRDIDSIITLPIYD